jgi:hypothetical protein
MLQLICNTCTFQLPGCNAAGLEVTSDWENYFKNINSSCVPHHSPLFVTWNFCISFNLLYAMPSWALVKYIQYFSFKQNSGYMLPQYIMMIRTEIILPSKLWKALVTILP